MIAEIRRFFEARNVLEVTTPALYGHAPYDPHLSSIAVTTSSGTEYLQTSPEYALKRALAHYGEALFEITPAFRAGDVGQRHSPEFTMLEWYQPTYGLSQLMAEVNALLNAMTQPPAIWQEYANKEIPEVSFCTTFTEQFGANPNQLSTIELWALVQSVESEVGHLTYIDDDLFRSDCLDFLFDRVIAPNLGPIFYLTEFPVCQSALATIDSDAQTVRRFELYWMGIELANGYEELRDPVEIRQRFRSAAEQRRRRGLTEVALDPAFVEASGEMPACAGVALGLDRLIMVWLERSSLREVQINFAAD